MGIDQLIEDSSSTRLKDLVFVKSSADGTNVSIPGLERSEVFETKGFILPNHDTGRIIPTESQVNTNDPSVVITDSSATEYDSADESSICSTPLLPLEKLVGVEPVSGPKTIKSILKLYADKRTDNRVIGLIKRMGSEVNPKQKRRLCMNKVDLVENKKDLLMVADQFKDLPGYERYFMIYGLKDFGVKDLTQYLTEHALKRPWDEDPLIMTDDVLNISLEVVREKLLDHIHQGTLKGLRITVVISSGREGDGEGPAWAPLFNNYMLTTSKLQDWDKADELRISDDETARIRERALKNMLRHKKLCLVLDLDHTEWMAASCVYMVGSWQYHNGKYVGLRAYWQIGYELHRFGSSYGDKVVGGSPAGKLSSGWLVVVPLRSGLRFPCAWSLIYISYAPLQIFLGHKETITVHETDHPQKSE
ncbi:hypothetical protein Tco_1082909 [Tanacetum coccineum]|uniref:Uncharacterized protein n=1 Tax=Tanacetum coccineum TaxID=301880 RepID=A0ABQ5I308_9ASTR